MSYFLIVWVLSLCRRFNCHLVEFFSVLVIFFPIRDNLSFPGTYHLLRVKPAVVAKGIHSHNLIFLFHEDDFSWNILFNSIFRRSDLNGWILISSNNSSHQRPFNSFVSISQLRLQVSEWYKKLYIELLLPLNDA